MSNSNSTSVSSIFFDHTLPLCWEGIYRQGDVYVVLSRTHEILLPAICPVRLGDPKAHLMGSSIEPVVGVVRSLSWSHDLLQARIDWTLAQPSRAYATPTYLQPEFSYVSTPDGLIRKPRVLCGVWVAPRPVFRQEDKVKWME